MVVPYVKPIERPSDTKIQELDSQMSSILSNPKLNIHDKVMMYNQSLAKFQSHFDPDSYGESPALMGLANTVEVLAENMEKMANDKAQVDKSKLEKSDAISRNNEALSANIKEPTRMLNELENVKQDLNNIKTLQKDETNSADNKKLMELVMKNLDDIKNKLEAKAETSNMTFDDNDYFNYNQKQSRFTPLINARNPYTLKTPVQEQFDMQNSPYQINKKVPSEKEASSANEKVHTAISKTANKNKPSEVKKKKASELDKIDPHRTNIIKQRGQGTWLTKEFFG
jgi:hypothetical protein